jgi:hypothetical protein
MVTQYVHNLLSFAMKMITIHLNVEKFGKIQ